jgi:hypothetical protein
VPACAAACNQQILGSRAVDSGSARGLGTYGFSADSGGHV